ncbi:MAG: hypothetical protein JRI74_11700, partial [Deltaproteobacteria bacterium]|nr:hypothetical protein [Deltaproteobacteria bacterium]
MRLTFHLTAGFGSAKLINCSVSGNTAGEKGGGIYLNEAP